MFLLLFCSSKNLTPGPLRAEWPRSLSENQDGRRVAAPTEDSEEDSTAGKSFSRTT
jgi:hypothetical protein